MGSNFKLRRWARSSPRSQARKPFAAIGIFFPFEFHGLGAQGLLMSAEVFGSSYTQYAEVIESMCDIMHAPCLLPSQVPSMHFI
jgi:hypothetical protein